MLKVLQRSPQKSVYSKQAKHRNPPRKRRVSKIQMFLVPLVGAMFGVSLILYPVIATRHNNAEQQRTLEEYRVNIKEAKSDDLAQALTKADQYNNDLREGKIIDPFLVDVIPDSEEYQNYLKQLNLAKVMGQLIVPSVRINLPIYHGTEEDTLQKGLGHLFGSSLPVGGKATHAVLTGHSGLSNATMFDNLPKVKKGDKIFLNVAGRDMQYVVREIKVVLPEETDSLKRQGDRDLLTLITCTPYGINSHRLFVTAEREYPVDEKTLNQAVSDKDAPWETWMIVLILIASSGVIAIGTIIGKTFLLLKNRSQKRNSARTDGVDSTDSAGSGSDADSGDGGKECGNNAGGEDSSGDSAGSGNIGSSSHEGNENRGSRDHADNSDRAEQGGNNDSAGSGVNRTADGDSANSSNTSSTSPQQETNKAASTSTDSPIVELSDSAKHSPIAQSSPASPDSSTPQLASPNSSEQQKSAEQEFRIIDLNDEDISRN